MPATNIGSRWNAGDLEFFDTTTGANVLVLDTGALLGVGDQGERLPVVHFYTFASADGNVDNDQTITHQTEITGAWLIKVGAAGNAGANTVQLQTGAAVAISDAMNIQNAAASAVVRAATINPAANTIAAGGVLRIRTSKAQAADNNAIQVAVLGRRV
jgi:type II secretory pathway component PulF